MTDDVAPGALPESRALGQALTAAGVRFVHWKSNSHLAEALAGLTDLDVYVPEEDRAAFLQVMGERRALEIVSQPWASYPGVCDFLAFDAATGGLLHLHVHHRLVTGLKRVKHLEFPWGAALLDNTRRIGEASWPAPAAELELLFLLVRSWAKMPPLRRLWRPRIPGHIRDEFAFLASAADAARMADLARQLNLPLTSGDIVALLAAPDDPSVILPLARRAYGAMAAHRRMAWPMALLAAAGLNLRLAAARFRKRFIGPAHTGKRIAAGGAMIAIIGSDGSGKSTLAADLSRWLAYKLDVHRLYMGSGDGNTGLVNRLRRMVAGAVRKRRPKVRRVVSEAPPRPAGFAEKLYRLLDLRLMARKVRHLDRARPLIARGSVVVVDRYPQRQFAGINDGPRLQHAQGFAWAAAKERALYAQAERLGPDLLLKLLVDPAVAHARKPDHDRDTMARKCAIVAALEFPQAKVVTIDADAPYDEVLLAAKRAVWQHLAR